MSNDSRKSIPVSDVSFDVDDETLEQLQSLSGQSIAAAVVWDDSIADALQHDELADPAVDMDVYLSDGVFFELYGVLCYPSLESDPLANVSDIQKAVVALANSGVWLEELATDTEDDLVLVLSDRDGPVLYLNAGAWRLEEWEELPDPA